MKPSSKRSVPVLGLAALLAAAAAGSQASAGTSAGTLVLSGGIHGTVRLNSSNCVAGPGPNLNVTGVSSGGWGLLFLKASDPSGKRGAAALILEGNGYGSNVGAVATWSWNAKKNSGHSSAPSLSIASNGEAGTIRQLLSVGSSYDGPRVKPVEVTASWNAGTCKTNE